MLIVSLGACIFACVGLKNTAFDTDYKIMFPERSWQIENFNNFENTFAKDDAIIFAVEAKNGTAIRKDALSALHKITEKTWLISNVTRVDSLTNFLNTSISEDELVVTELLELPEDVNENKLAEISKLAGTHEALVGRYVSKDKTMLTVLASLEMPVNDPVEALNTVAQARKLRDEIKNEFPDLNVYLTGNVLVGVAFGEAAERDMKSLIPIMYGVIIISLMFVLRSFVAMSLTMLMVLLSTFVTLGVVGWAGLPLNSSTASAPTIIMTLAIADAIHFFTGLFYYQRKGSNKHDAIVESLKSNFKPILFTSITTAVGFLSMNYFDVPPFRQLGNIVAFGVMVALVLIITMIPALVAILPIKSSLSKGTNNQFFTALTNLSINHAKKIVICFSMLVLFFALLLPKFVVDDNFIEYFDKSFDFRVETDKIDEALGGVISISYAVPAAGEYGITDPKYLSYIDEFANYAESLDKVTHVRSIVEVMKRLNRNLNGDKESEYRLPRVKDLASQYLLFYELSLPFGRDLSSQINMAKSVSRVDVTLKQVSTTDMLRITAKLDNWLKENTPSYMHARGTGMSVIFSNLYSDNSWAMIEGTVTSYVVITLCIGLVLASIRYAAISLLPNLIPVIMAYGVWYFLDGTVGMGTSSIAMCTIGIVVDDSIHFLSKFLGHGGQGVSINERIRKTLESTGPAILSTSIVLALGFMVLGFSGFMLNRDTGIMFAMTVLFAVVADLLFLPSVLYLLDSKNK